MFNTVDVLGFYDGEEEETIASFFTMLLECRRKTGVAIELPVTQEEKRSITDNNIVVIKLINDYLTFSTILEKAGNDGAELPVI